MSSGLFVSIPYGFLGSHMGLAAELGVNIEIQLDWQALQNPSGAVMDAILAEKERNGLEITVHAPFNDISPAASDPLSRDATLTRLRQAARFCGEAGAKVMVVHSGYDEKRYWMDMGGFVERSLDTWRRALDMTARSGVLIAMENVFEDGPGLHEEIIGKLGSERFGFCLDTGHLNIHSKASAAEWLDRLSPRMFEIHLHDNNGARDEHLAIGEGKMDFAPVFGALGNPAGPSPVLTVEAHSERGIRSSVDYLVKQGFAARGGAAAAAPNNRC